jgi:hypothetical protein
MRRLACVATLVVLACDPAEIDPEVSGVFPCETVQDCPPEQSCVIGTCFLEEPPRVTVVSPEAEFAFPIAAEARMEIVVTIGGENLQLVDPGEDPDNDFGKGNVVVLVDGVEETVLTAGALQSGVTLRVGVDAAPGAHRIVAFARNSAGIHYDNEEAEGRRLFWLDNGTPQVAFVSPFPGDVFPLEAGEIEVSVATLNFQLDSPMSGVDLGTEPIGHAHVHYDERFPECAADPLCDSNHVGVVAPPGPSTSAHAMLALPASAEDDATLTAVLRGVDHVGFFYPRWTEDPVWEDIVIRRTSRRDP